MYPASIASRLQASQPQPAYNGTDYGQLTESRKQLQDAIGDVDSAASSFNRQMERLAPGNTDEAWTKLREDAGYTGHVNQRGEITEVNSVDKMSVEAKTLRAQATTLFTDLDQAYKKEDGPEIFRLQAQVLPLLEQLEGAYRSLSFRAEAAASVETENETCQVMDEYIIDYLNTPDGNHSAKAKHATMLSSMAKELPFPLHPIDDRGCAAILRDADNIIKRHPETDQIKMSTGSTGDYVLTNDGIVEE